jgi:formylglycine-generating enzyme required for sulfatase activity
MPQLNKGSLLLRCAVHALQVGLEKMPVVGAVVELAQGWFEIFRDEYHQANFQERLAQLEEAAAMSPNEARAIAREVIEAERATGAVISEEKAEAIADLLAFVPATIKERTRATLYQARQRGTALQTVLPMADTASPTEQETFYRSLLPARRPRFQVGDGVPNANPNWQLAEFLASGGFGEVWAMQHARLRYAIKFCLDQVSAKALKREADALFTLHEQLPEHRHIVRLIDINLTVEPYWLAFDFVDGGTLEALLQAAPLSWQESLHWFRPIVEAVAAVHRIGIVHRDLKPANILLTTYGIPKIADFGIGKIVAESETMTRATRSRYTMLGFGSVGYLSPEQAEGFPADPTDDTYALGVMLWQMLSHSLKAPNLQTILKLQQLEVPQALKTVVLECLTQPREQRPADAGVLLEMLPSEGVEQQKHKVEELESRKRKAEELERQKREAEEAQRRKREAEEAQRRKREAEELERQKQTFDFEIVIVNAKGEIIQREQKQAQYEIEDLGNGVTLEMVSIPGGTFLMGSPENEKERLDSEGPQHRVTIQPFWLGKYPITQRQWQAVMGNNPARFKGDNRPVECVSWKDVVEFCQRLSEKTGKTYRLPSEAEWEYACRAGTTTPFYFGETITTDLVNYDGNSPYASAPTGIYRKQTTEVGIFPPNAFGLYDMHGNVWEWCADPWHENYKGAPTDGSVWQEGADKGLFALRGGSWLSYAGRSRAAYRCRGEPTNRGDGLGARLARQ